MHLACKTRLSNVRDTCVRVALYASVSKADSRRGLHESMEGYLARLTHLTLNEKNIGRIDMLVMTPGLRVLYLYDNCIRRMHALDELTKLTHLYLQNNLIERIAGLDRLKTLTKLYLDGNRISYVDGLEHCTNLEELHISGQRLQPGEELRFNPSSMEVRQRHRYIVAETLSTRFACARALVSSDW